MYIILYLLCAQSIKILFLKAFLAANTVLTNLCNVAAGNRELRKLKLRLWEQSMTRNTHNEYNQFYLLLSTVASENLEFYMSFWDGGIKKIINILNILDLGSFGELTDLIWFGFSAIPISFAQKVTEWKKKKLFSGVMRGNREGMDPTFKGLWSSMGSTTCP